MFAGVWWCWVYLFLLLEVGLFVVQFVVFLSGCCLIGICLRLLCGLRVDVIIVVFVLRFVLDWFVVCWLFVFACLFAVVGLPVLWF